MILSRLRAVTLVALTATMIGCHTQEQEIVEKHNGWGFSSFPIGGWHQPPATPDALQRYADANFNLVMSRGEAAVAEAEKIGLASLLVHGGANRPFAQKALDEMLGIAQRHPKMVGTVIWDEPSPVSFPEIAQWTAAFRQARPDLLAWVNLHPVKIVEEELPGVTEYPPYLEKFIESVKPDVLSYDNYSTLRESNDDVVFYKNYIDSTVFYNMAQFRRFGLKHDVPFWGFALATPHWTYFTPTEQDLRFQVYSLVTYGAKGIWYFTYQSLFSAFNDLSDEMKAKTEIELGLIDEQGAPTVRYPIVQQINAELLALGPTLLRLTSTGIYHLDEPKLPRTYYLEDPKETLALPREPLPADGYLRSVTGGQPLVGLFTDTNGDDYFMVMNKNRRQFDVVSRVALGLDRQRDPLLNGHTLGQMFHADKPISAVSLLVSTYSQVGQGATLRIRRDGPDGEEVALWKWFNLFADNAVIVRFNPLPPGDYYIELSALHGSKIGWWGKAVAEENGGAYADGMPVNTVVRNFIAYGVPELSPDTMTLTFGANVVTVEEVSKVDGTLKARPLQNSTLTLSVAQGDGHLFRVPGEAPIPSIAGGRGPLQSIAAIRD